LHRRQILKLLSFGCLKAADMSNRTYRSNNTQVTKIG